jgi:hypothetical protein
LIGYTDKALEQVRVLRRHYETLARDAAIQALDRALTDAEAKIERAPAKGLPAPRPYPQLARPGWAWVKSLVLASKTAPRS